MKSPSCRFCSNLLSLVMCDLGMSPLANDYVKPCNAGSFDKLYPLKVWVCQECLLAQLEVFQAPDQIFSDYLYFSSYSTSWVEHARRLCDTTLRRFQPKPSSRVVEIASNDGYLLQHFKAADLLVVGVEPAANVARVASEQRGIPTLVKFFGTQTAREMVASEQTADLLVGLNVLAHVPDINDFVAGLKIVLNPEGILILEFPHLLRLIEQNQFDTIYHEHFSYLSLLFVDRVLSHHGLMVFDVEEVGTHGGSLRVFGRHAEKRDLDLRISQRVAAVKAKEHELGLAEMSTFERFGERVRATKRALLRFLIDTKEAGKSVVGYGAPAKGVTLLNYCGVGLDLVDYVVDRSPHKQGCLLPGVRIPILPPDKIAETRPDYVLILPWNLHDEITQEMRHVSSWGGQFVVPIPDVRVL